MQRSAHSLEFTILMASLMSIVALTIDAVLPALGAIHQHFQLSNANQTQWVIICVFSGMMVGHLISGPLSDAIGRKKILYLGLFVYMLGGMVCYLSPNFEGLLLGRIIQGLGVSGPYIASISTIRDKYSGEQMAKIMSLIMMVFMVVPALAPSIGQAIIRISSWQAIFIFYLSYAMVIAIWVSLRLEETLIPEKRRPLQFKIFKAGVLEIIKNKTTMSYLVCAGLCFGAFMSYLSTSQQIFMQQFGKTGTEFSLYFALLAVAMGCASFVNARIVEKIGMRRICFVGTLSMSLLSSVFVLLQVLGMPIGFWVFMIYAALLFFLQGLVFGNLNSVAMQPMGKIAGMASALIGASSSMLSLSLGSLIGQMYNGTLIPMASGFAVLCAIACTLIVLEQRFWQVHH